MTTLDLIALEAARVLPIGSERHEVIAAYLAALSQPQAGEAQKKYCFYCDKEYSGAKCPHCQGYMCSAAPQPALAVAEDQNWQKLRDLFGLDGWHDGHYNGVTTPAHIIAHAQYIAEDRAKLLAASMASPPPSGEVRWSYDEVERIILDTEPSEMSDRGDKIWTRRMAVALADKFNAALSSAAPTADGWKLVPEIPTEEQMTAGLYQASHDATYADVCQSYMDMVKVAPAAPTATGDAS